MANAINWIYFNVPFIGQALALWLSGDSTELFYEMSDRPVYNSPWGWHERIRWQEKNGFFVSSAWKASQMSKHNLWIFCTPMVFSVDRMIVFHDGSKGYWNKDFTVFTEKL